MDILIKLNKHQYITQGGLIAPEYFYTKDKSSNLIDIHVVGYCKGVKWLLHDCKVAEWFAPVKGAKGVELLLMHLVC